MQNSKIPKKMKAAVLYGVDDVRVEERDVPVPGYQEVLLKVDAASICGTDIKVMHRHMGKQPEDDFIMGHEYAGTIVAVGNGVDEFKVGERVAVEIHKGCGVRFCVRRWNKYAPTRIRRSRNTTSRRSPHTVAKRDMWRSDTKKAESVRMNRGDVSSV